MTHTCSFWRCANSIGLFLVIFYVLCFLRYSIYPVSQELHLSTLQVAYFGFSGMNFPSFILGAVQTYLWAYIGLGIWQLVGCCFKIEKCDK